MPRILSASAMSYFSVMVQDFQSSITPSRMCCRNVPRQGRVPFTFICSAAVAVPLPSYVRGGVRRAELTEQQILINTTTSSQESSRKRVPAAANRLASARAAPTPSHFPANINMASMLSSTPGLLGGSHTQPASGGIAAHGCYRVIGPAHISKRGDCLVARLLPGARLELLSGGGAGSASATAASLEAPPLPLPGAAATGGGSGGGGGYREGMGPMEEVRCDCTVEEGEDEEGMDGGGGDGAVAECVLVAAYVELGGSASSIDSVDVALQHAVHHHNGHTYLNVRHLPADIVIRLPPDGDLSHPVNVTPSPPQQELKSSSAPS